MNLSLEERRRRLFEGACESCDGGDDGGEAAGADGSEGPGAETDDKFLNVLSKLRKKVKTRKKDGS